LAFLPEDIDAGEWPGIILVTMFFVTSSDSGSLVVDSIASGGKPDAPVGQRIFWALLEGAVAAALLFAGGLKALQSVVISAGLPFTVLLLFVIYSLYQAFQKEANEMRMLAIKREREEYIESIKQLLKSEEENDFLNKIPLCLDLSSIDAMVVDSALLLHQQSKEGEKFVLLHNIRYDFMQGYLDLDQAGIAYLTIRKTPQLR
jgi:hypothetical protein